MMTPAPGSRWVLVCPLVFKTSDRGEEPLRWVRFPHIPAKRPAAEMLRDIFFVGEVRNEIPHFRQEYRGFIPPSIFLLASYKCFQ